MGRGDLVYACPWNVWCVILFEVSIREGETQESLLRRFQRMVQMSGVLREAKSHRYFLSKRDAARQKVKRNARRRRIGK
jgi:ribosomal protein S21